MKDNIIKLNKENEPMTTSLIIAKEFGKPHDDVLKAIRSLKCSEKFRVGNFTESSYTNTQNKKQPMYEMKRDGFMFLVMGFTGDKAAEIKEKFIYAFNDMYTYIKQLEQNKYNEHWLDIRFKGKLLRCSLTDEIKKFVEYAKSQGSQHAEFYYMAITKLVNNKLFGVTSLNKIGKNLRDYCDFVQLAHITTAESIIITTLVNEIDNGTVYKEIYEIIRSKIDDFGLLIPQDKPSNIPQIEYNKCLSKKKQKELANSKLLN
jgi:Rha family phage regulatory protein